MIGWFRQDLRYKALALVCAFFLYMKYGRPDPNPITSTAVRVPVQAINVPEGLKPASLPVIGVTIQGPRAVLSEALASSDSPTDLVRATVDLRGRKVGSCVVRPRVTLKRSLRLEGDPPLVALTLEPVIRRRLPIDYVPQGSVAPDYRWESARVTPTMAEVQGPRSAVEQVARIEAHVPVRRATTDVERDVDLLAVDSMGEPVRNVGVFPPQARVRVRIARVRRYSTVPVVVRVEGTPARGFHIATVTVDPVVVTVSGSPQALEELQAVSTEPVDVDGATGPVIRDVSLRPPSGIIPVMATTARVKVYLAADTAGTP